MPHYRHYLALMNRKQYEQHPQQNDSRQPLTSHIYLFGNITEICQTNIFLSEQENYHDKK